MARFFQETQDNAAQLYFCSGNVRDFSLQLDDKQILHPCHKEGLPSAEYFVDLKSLVAFAKKHPKIKEPDPKQVERALVKERAIQDFFDHYVPYLASQQQNVTAILKNFKQQTDEITHALILQHMRSYLLEKPVGPLTLPDLGLGPQSHPSAGPKQEEPKQAEPKQPDPKQADKEADNPREPDEGK